MTFYSSLSFALTQRDEAYLWVGVELFPVLVNSVLTMQNQQQKVAIVYQINDHNAQIAAQQLGKFIKKPVEVLSRDQFLLRQDFQFVFLVDPGLLDDRLVRFAEAEQMLIFSPFLNALTFGADVGLLVKEQVRPSMSAKRLQQKHIAFKPFFVKVAHIYE